MLDAVLRVRACGVEGSAVQGGEQQDERLSGDAVDGDTAPVGVRGSDPVDEVVEGGQAGVGKDDLVGAGGDALGRVSAER